MLVMTQIKPHSDSFIDRLNRLDDAFAAWLKRYLPPVYHFTRLGADWLSRPHPNSSLRSVLLSGIAAFILWIMIYLLGR